MTFLMTFDDLVINLIKAKCQSSSGNNDIKELSALLKKLLSFKKCVYPYSFWSFLTFNLKLLQLHGKWAEIFSSQEWLWFVILSHLLFKSCFLLPLLFRYSFCSGFLHFLFNVFIHLLFFSLSSCYASFTLRKRVHMHKQGEE